jgi:hypothetical protein
MTKPCKICGKSFDARGRAENCGSVCKQEAWRRYMREYARNHRPVKLAPKAKKPLPVRKPKPEKVPMVVVCKVCGKEFNPIRNTQKLCKDPECKRAAWNEYQKSRYTAQKPKTEGYGREPGIRADRYIDTEKPLPPEKIIIQTWSDREINRELARLDQTIARCRELR